MTNQGFPNLSIAIPDSSLSDEQTNRDKTIKIAQFARACAIFRVSKIYIYHDRSLKSGSQDLPLLITILRYLDTPQYLRKALFPHSNELVYAGILHPLNTPHHQKKKRLRDVKLGDVRVGIIREVKGRYYADVGLERLVLLEKRNSPMKKINVKITSTMPLLKGVEADSNDISAYWGYDVLKVGSLAELMESLSNTQIILTSKEGCQITNADAEISALKSSRNILVIFGSPKKGIYEILAREGGKVKNTHMIVNTFPLQATRTVRLEEAVLGSLAIITYILLKKTR